MRGFMITTDYKTHSNAFGHNCIVIDMYDDTKTIINTIDKEAKTLITKCDGDHPLIVCLHLDSWTSYKTVQRLYLALSLFRDNVKDEHGIGVLVDFTSVTAETLVKFNLLSDFEALSGGTSIDIKEE